MTFRKWLVAFLILLFLSPLIPLAYAGPGPNVPVLEHPWDDVHSISPTIVKQQHIYPALNKVYFYSVLPFNSSVFMLVGGDKKQEVVKKDLSVKNLSLPRKK
jgi:hypothetical protein